MLTYNANPEILETGELYSSFNPIPAGVFESQYVWCPNNTNDTSLESSYALLLESANAKKLQTFKN